MTRFVFVRHGESLLNLEKDLVNGRSNDIPLTPRGLTQARLLGAYLKDNEERFDAIFSSGAVRADTTARAIIDAAGYDNRLQTDERLLELSQGPWSGLERGIVYAGDVVEKYRLMELSGSLPGAESVKQGQARGRDFIDEKSELYPEGNLLVVSHGLLIRSVVADILGLTKQEILAMETPNVSMTTLTVHAGDKKVVSVGKTVISE